MAGLYIHVPFCISKCKYCDFYSLPLKDAGPGDVYLEAMQRELADLPDPFHPETIYIGGGTPTSLSLDQLQRLVGIIGEAIDVGQVQEWTCEANPGTVDPDKAHALRDAGVNRVSLGVQSFRDANLDLLGRSHKASDAESAYALLREAGFDNLSLDLIYAIPGTSRRLLRDDLARMIDLNPEHIAAYCLTFEPGTPLTELRELGRVEEVSGEEALAQYTLIRETLASAGYEQYEISNFARPGRACRHNLLYWGPGEYVGCGPAAHSHWSGVRYSNVGHLDRYCTAWLDGGSPRDDEEKLEPEAKAREALVMGLRRIDGVARDKFLKETGFDYHDLRNAEITDLCARGLLIEEGNSIRLSEQALFISNSVFAELV